MHRKNAIVKAVAFFVLIYHYFELEVYFINTSIIIRLKINDFFF
jgi:hypothetical protein